MAHARLVTTLAATLALTVTGVTTAGAVTGGEGVLDPSFGFGGRMVDWAHSSIPFATATQPDGKTLVVTDGSVFRYTSTGDPDSSFGSDGRAPLGSSMGVAGDAIALLSDGRFLVAGFFDSGPGVMRFLSSGALDRSFGTQGVQTLPLGGDPAGNPGSIVVAPDGRIVLGGYLQNGAVLSQAVWRLSANGTPDSSFDDDGLLKDVFADDARAVDVLSDGKILSAANVFNGADNDIELSRFTSDGQLDDTFNPTDHTGIVLIKGQGDETASDVKMHGGYIYVVGTATPSSADAAIYRFNADGGTDFGFGGGGAREFNVRGTEQGGSVAFQRDGKIVVSGYTQDPGANPAVRGLLAVRLMSDGSDDPTFPIQTIQFGSFDVENVVKGLTVQRDGRIVFGGEVSGVGINPALVRLIGDATAPAAGTLSTGTPRFALSARAVKWHAADDNTGVATYDVRRRVAGYKAASFGSASLFRSKTTRTSASYSGAAGTTACFAARARDWAGNLGPYGGEHCVSVPVDDRAASRHGKWLAGRSARWFRHTSLVSTTAGSALTLRVAYKHLALVVSTCSTCGKVKVYLGSKLLRRLDLHSAHSHDRIILPVSSSSVVRKGTLRIVQSAGGKAVRIDGIGVSLS